jgi:hypothetical protein
MIGFIDNSWLQPACVTFSYNPSFGESLFQRLHALPATRQPLFPQADTVVASADSQHVTAQTPAHAPSNGIDVENGGLPFV